MYCLKCGKTIPHDREECIIDFNLPQSCYDCSTVEAPVVFMNYSHKTAGEILVVPQNIDGTNDPEKIRIAKRAFQRRR